MGFCKFDNIRKIIVGLCVALVMVFGAAINAHAYADVEYTDTIINFDMGGQGEVRGIYVSGIEGCDGAAALGDCYCEMYGIHDATCTCTGIHEPTTVTILVQITKFWNGYPTDEYELGVEYCLGGEGEVTFVFDGEGAFEPWSLMGRCEAAGMCGGGSSSSSWCDTNCYSDDYWQWLFVDGNGEHYPDDTSSVIYQYKRKRVSCDSSSRKCVRNIEYRCVDGYFGVPYVDGLIVRGCEVCPEGACCGVIVDGFGQPVTEDHTIAVAKAKDSCMEYASYTTIGDGRIVIEDCGMFDSSYVSLLTDGYVRTEANLYGAGQCKDLGSPDYYSLPDGYDSCKTDFRLEAKEDTGPSDCESGQYRDYSTGKTVCKACPAATVDGVAYNTLVIDNWSGSFKNRVYDCVTDSGPYTDSTGTFIDYGNCVNCSEDL